MTEGSHNWSDRTLKGLGNGHRTMQRLRMLTFQIIKRSRTGTLFTPQMVCNTSPARTAWKTSAECRKQETIFCFADGLNYGCRPTIWNSVHKQTWSVNYTNRDLLPRCWYFEDLRLGGHGLEKCIPQEQLPSQVDVLEKSKTGNETENLPTVDKVDKKAVLSQRWPRHARYISRSWAVAEIIKAIRNYPTWRRLPSWIYSNRK